MKMFLTCLVLKGIAADAIPPNIGKSITKSKNQIIIRYLRD